MSQQAQPGWYADPQGVVRWWDGQQWTDHVQQAEQVPDSSIGTVSGLQPAGGDVALAGAGAGAAVGSGSRSGLMWLLSFVAVAAVGVAVYFVTKGDDKEPQASTSTPVVNESAPVAGIPTKTPGEVVTALYMNQFDFDCDALINLLSEKASGQILEDAQSEGEEVCAYLEPVKSYDADGEAYLELPDPERFAVISEDIDGEEAVVTYVDGRNPTQQVLLVLESGQWRYDRLLYVHDEVLKVDLRSALVKVVESLTEDPSGDAAWAISFQTNDGVSVDVHELDIATGTLCIYAYHPEASGYHSIDQDGLIYEDGSCGQG